MDKNSNAFYFEMIKNTFGLAMIYYLGSWFQIDDLIPFGTYIVTAYLFISTFAVAYFSFGEIKIKLA